MGGSFDRFLPVEVNYLQRGERMATHRKKPILPGGVEDRKKKLESQAADDDCRCKSTALMSPRQLLRLMMDDLSFRKKPKKG